MTHLAWENRERTQWLLSILTETMPDLYMSKEVVEKLDKMLLMWEGIIGIGDSLRAWRVRLALNYENNGLLFRLWQRHGRCNVLTVAVANLVVKLVHSDALVAGFLHAKRRKWAWLEDQMSKHRAWQDMVALPSGVEDVGLLHGQLHEFLYVDECKGSCSENDGNSTVEDGERGDGGGSSGKKANTNWECQACTFANGMHVMRCEMCNSPKLLPPHDQHWLPSDAVGDTTPAIPFLRRMPIAVSGGVPSSNSSTASSTASSASIPNERTLVMYNRNAREWAVDWVCVSCAEVNSNEDTKCVRCNQRRQMVAEGTLILNERGYDDKVLERVTKCGV